MTTEVDRWRNNGAFLDKPDPATCYAPYYHIPDPTENCSVPHCKGTPILGFFDEFCEMAVCKEHDDSGESIFIWIEP